MTRILVCGCCATAWLVVGASTVIAERGPHWCRTMDNWIAKDPPQEGGGCPIEGECDIPSVRDSWIPDETTPIRVIRIMFHVFAEDDGSNPTATALEVEQQLETLNEHYLPSRLQFVAETQFINSTEFRFYSSGEEFAMKSTYAISPESQLNIYVVRTSGFSVGYFPWWPEALDFMGGIVMHEFHFGPTASTLAHEVGHNTGLWHTHHGVSEVSNCSACYERADGVDGDTTGDFAGDTPGTPVNFSCGPPGGTDSCSATPWGETDFRDFMGYAPSECVDHFTEHQRGRQQCWVDGVLTGWLCAECTDPGACCEDGGDGSFVCSEVLASDCAGTFFGQNTSCDDLGVGADRCDCNGNGVVDLDDIVGPTSEDCNGNVVPDECESDADCDVNGVQDICDIADGTSDDCNGNGVPDGCDIDEATSDDCDGNGVPDECSPDCNGNAVVDACDISDGTSLDDDANGVPDECQRVIYVAAAATGANDGSSWDDAFTELRDALDAADLGDDIHVAHGRYAPSDVPIRTASFFLLDGVRLYGGFAGPSALDGDARNPRVYETVLSGDLSNDDEPGFENRFENAFNVLTSVGHDETTVVDGFTIRGGNANGASIPADAGGGMRIESGSPRLVDCVFEDNSGVFGGGLECFFGGDPTLIGCVFRDNLATFRGGGMHVNGSSPTLIGCDFVNNVAENSGGGLRCRSFSNPVLHNCRFVGNSASFGGGMVNDETDASVVGCLFTGNTADDTSGGMHNWRSDPLIVGGTFSGNVAGVVGGGMYNLSGSRPTLNNCILWGNRDQNGLLASSQIALANPGETPLVDYSCIQGGWPAEAGEGNISADPLFMDADGADGVYGTADDDTRLFRDSLCIDAGDPDSDTDGADLDGHGRALCGRVDMGAYEFGIGDYTCDGRVGISDFEWWSDCSTGPDGGLFADGCEAFDLDADADVDLIDFGGFQRVYMGDCDVAITQGPVGGTVCEGLSTSLEVVASGSDGGPVSYQWRRDGTDISGATSAEFVIESADEMHIGAYRCVVTAGCRDMAFTGSADLVVTDPATEFSLHPVGGSRCVGGSVFMIASASNAPNYQWTKDGVPIENATSTFLSLGNLTVEDSGVYNLVASNGCNTDISDDAVIIVTECADSP